MVLPGKVAKETRAQFAGIIQRYMAGDESLHAEIQRNAESDSSIAQLARAGMEKRPASSADLGEGPAPKRVGMTYQMAAKVVQSNKQISSAIQAIPNAVGNEIRAETGKVLGGMAKIGQSTMQIEKGVNKELKIVREKNSKQEYCVAKLNETVRNKDAQIKTKDDLLVKKDKMIEHLQDILPGTRSEVRFAIAKIDVLSVDANQLKAENAVLKASNARLEASNAKLELIINQLRTDTDEMRAGINQLRTDTDEMRTGINQLLSIFGAVYGT